MLLWSYYPALNSNGILTKINEYSTEYKLLNNKKIRVIELPQIINKLEKKYAIEEFIVKTKVTDDKPFDLQYFEVKFELSLINGKNIKEAVYIPATLKVEFGKGEKNYDIKITNKKINDGLIQKIEFNGPTDNGEKMLMNNKDGDTYNIKYDLDKNSIEYVIIFTNNSIKVIIDRKNEFVQELELDITKIRQLVIKKTDNKTYFKNINFNYLKIYENEKEEKIEINKSLNVEYNVSIAVFFIVNVFQKNVFTLFHQNVYDFADLLISKGFKIYILSSVNSTIINLIKLFNDLKKYNTNDNKNSRFIFYYFGHTNT